MKMFLIGFTIYQDVVEENQDELPEKVSQRGVHCILKSSRFARKTKGHDAELKLPEMGLERRFELFSRLEQNLVESRA